MPTLVFSNANLQLKGWQCWSVKLKYPDNYKQLLMKCTDIFVKDH